MPFFPFRKKKRPSAPSNFEKIRKRITELAAYDPKRSATYQEFRRKIEETKVSKYR